MLTVGQRIDSHDTVWEITWVSNETADEARFRVVSCTDEILLRYVDIGAEYPVVRDPSWTGDLLVWNVPPEAVKKTARDLLLQWDAKLGWLIDTVAG